jgi:hypothetical protein
LVETGSDGERGEGKGVTRSSSGRSGSVAPLTSTQHGWGDSESKLTEVSSEDVQSWESGIRKTTVSTQNVR